VYHSLCNSCSRLQCDLLVTLRNGKRCCSQAAGVRATAGVTLCADSCPSSLAKLDPSRMPQAHRYTRRRWPCLAAARMAMSIMALRRRHRPRFRWLPDRYPLTAPALASSRQPQVMTRRVTYHLSTRLRCIPSAMTQARSGAVRSAAGQVTRSSNRPSDRHGQSPVSSRSPLAWISSATPIVTRSVAADARDRAGAARAL